MAIHHEHVPRPQLRPTLSTSWHNPPQLYTILNPGRRNGGGITELEQGSQQMCNLSNQSYKIQQYACRALSGWETATGCSGNTFRHKEPAQFILLPTLSTSWQNPPQSLRNPSNLPTIGEHNGPEIIEQEYRRLEVARWPKVFSDCVVISWIVDDCIYIYGVP